MAIAILNITLWHCYLQYRYSRKHALVFDIDIVWISVYTWRVAIGITPKCSFLFRCLHRCRKVVIILGFLIPKGSLALVLLNSYTRCCIYGVDIKLIRILPRGVQYLGCWDDTMTFRGILWCLPVIWIINFTQFQSASSGKNAKNFKHIFKFFKPLVNWIKPQTCIIKYIIKINCMQVYKHGKFILISWNK